MHYACYGAVGEVLDRAAPEVSAKMARAGFGERDVRRAAGWVQQWRDATASTKGFGSRRLDGPPPPPPPFVLSGHAASLTPY